MSEAIYRLKFLIKYSLAAGLYYSGLLSLIKYIKFKNRAIVLTYHRVLPYSVRDGSFSHSAIMVDNGNFERQIKFLKRHFKLLNTADFLAAFREHRPFTDSGCLITFDDGWRDNYEYAFPILKSHGVSALIFPATDYIGSGKLFWQEAMGHGFYQLLAGGNNQADEFLQQHDLLWLRQQEEAVKLDRIRQYVRELKSCSYEELDGIMQRMQDILGSIDYGEIDRYLDWQQIREMHEHGIEFGSHACSHRILTRLDRETASTELQQSKQSLQDATGVEIKTIAYPNGDYDNDLGKLTRQAGYEIGFGTRFGQVSHEDNPFDIQRININDMTSRNNPIMLATILGII